MQGLPSRLIRGQAAELTGFSCPECYGVLDAKVEGHHGYILLCCRTGHTFTSGELLRGKENRVETLLWASVTALEELIELLKDLAGRDDPAASRTLCEERLRAATRQAAELKAIVQANSPIMVGGEDESNRR